MAKVKTAVITAAGFGTRFLPIVKSIPKEMLPIVDKPILQYVVEECIEAEIENIIIVVREGNDIIENYFTTDLKAAEDLLESVGKGDRYDPVRQLLSIKGLKFVNQREDLPYGNGTPIISAKHLIPENEPFAVLFADDLVLAREKGALRQIIDTFEEHNPIGIVGVQKTPKEELYRYGIVEPSEVYDEKSGVLDMIIEKPEPGEVPSDLAVFGRYVVSYDLFKYLREDATGKDNEIWLTDANDKLSRDGKFMYKVVDGKWMTTGDPARYFEAQVNYFLGDYRYRDGAEEFLKKLNS